MEIKIDKLSEKQKTWYEPYLLYEKALLTFHQKQYFNALELVTTAINNYKAELDIILSNAYLLQGMIFDKLYRRAEAKVSYYNCINLDNFSGSIERAKLYLKQPFYKVR